MDDVSRRVVEQRVRNRILEMVQDLTDGAGLLSSIGLSEYFNMWYDWVPHRDDPVRPKLSTWSEAEHVAVASLSAVIDDACDANSDDMSAKDFLATDWVQSIEDAAKVCLNILSIRGRMSEETEEHD